MQQQQQQQTRPAGRRPGLCGQRAALLGGAFAALPPPAKTARSRRDDAAGGGVASQPRPARTCLPPLALPPDASRAVSLRRLAHSRAERRGGRARWPCGLRAPKHPLRGLRSSRGTSTGSKNSWLRPGAPPPLLARPACPGRQSGVCRCAPQRIQARIGDGGGGPAGCRAGGDCVARLRAIIRRERVRRAVPI